MVFSGENFASFTKIRRKIVTIEPSQLADLVQRLRIAARNKALPIGEAWNLLDESADNIEIIINKLEHVISELDNIMKLINRANP